MSKKPPTWNEVIGLRKLVRFWREEANRSSAKLRDHRTKIDELRGFHVLFVHNLGCASLGNWWREDTRECDCGLDAARRELEGRE